MNTKMIFTRSSPIRTVLVNEVTGQELYRIATPRRFVGSVTRVFRCGTTTPPIPNPTSELRQDVDEPCEDRVSGEGDPLTVAEPNGSEEGDGNDGEGEDGVEGAGEGALGDHSPLVENEIARWYWKWFSSPRLVFEGKISTRAKYMPLKSRMKGGYVFDYDGVSYRWSLPLENLRCPKLVIDSSGTLIAEFRPNLFKKGKPYLEVTPAGMAMLDHIVVTFIPVEVNRQRAGG